MSLLIQNIDMPCMCCLCPCHDWDTETDRYYCQALKNEPRIIDENTRRDDCPLREIPTPHGRLIDADVACEKYKDEDSLVAELAYRKIRNAPTVIEAEG